MAVNLYMNLVKIIEKNKSEHDEKHMSDAAYTAECNNLKKRIEAFKGKQLSEEAAKELIEKM
jgi:hypothetical protein